MLLRLDLPQIPPLPQSHPALTIQVTHRFPGRGDFLKQEVALLPAPDILEFSQRGEDNPLGRAALASILLAKESGALLYPDDFVLRTVASNRWGVAGSGRRA